ncbi:hypothetical protein C477_14308 [Haloterrigena salina JCM 13891]|uniref:Uncharacterized protein n=1 Tax=Haloterrigena salina JCM 13891 TaxID=1227488 RepID=M0C295_9EURY|nr:hypothetical protein C477_14308 [Haloterrigena salina JCM 13891]
MDWGESTAAIVAMGLALAVAGIVRTLETPVSQPAVAFELFVSLLVPTGLATGGYWLASRNVSSDIRWRAVTRVSIGIVVACGLAAWLTVYVALEGGAIRDPLSLMTTLAAVGGATGFATAVREPLGIASSDSIASSVSTSARAAATESSATAESDEAIAQSPATTESSIHPTMERPTAAAVATVTTALESTTTDTVPTTDRSTDGATADSDASPTAGTGADAEASQTVSAATPSESEAEAGASPAIWNDTSPEGRTAAPARPVEPPEPTTDDDSVPETFETSETPRRDASDDAPDSKDPLESPTPRRDPGVAAVAAVPSTAETVLDVLRTERVRLTLAILYHEWDGQARSVDELARAVSSHTDDSADAVAAGLAHATLPRLAEIRAVDWDPYADRVSAPDHAVFEEGVREASALLESFEPGTR